MPTPAFMRIEGSTQGLITAGCSTKESVGNVFVAGHTDEFMVQAFDHNVCIPRDPQSGQPTGQRVHGPFRVTKVFDKSSPLLYQALCTGEMLDTCEVQWWRSNEKGKQEHYFTMKLEGAIVVEMQAHMPNCQDPGQAHFTHLEDIAFSYKKIHWVHELASTASEDDWSQPNVA